MGRHWEATCTVCFFYRVQTLLAVSGRSFFWDGRFFYRFKTCPACEHWQNKRQSSYTLGTALRYRGLLHGRHVAASRIRPCVLYVTASLLKEQASIQRKCCRSRQKAPPLAGPCPWHGTRKRASVRHAEALQARPVCVSLCQPKEKPTRADMGRVWACDRAMRTSCTHMFMWGACPAIWCKIIAP